MSHKNSPKKKSGKFKRNKIPMNSNLKSNKCSNKSKKTVHEPRFPRIRKVKTSPLKKYTTCPNVTRKLKSEGDVESSDDDDDGIIIISKKGVKRSLNDVVEQSVSKLSIESKQELLKHCDDSSSDNDPSNYDIDSDELDCFDPSILEFVKNIGFDLLAMEDIAQYALEINPCDLTKKMRDDIRNNPYFRAYSDIWVLKYKDSEIESEIKDQYDKFSKCLDKIFKLTVLRTYLFPSIKSFATTINELSSLVKKSDNVFGSIYITIPERNELVRKLTKCQEIITNIRKNLVIQKKYIFTEVRKRTKFIKYRPANISPGFDNNVAKLINKFTRGTGHIKISSPEKDANSAFKCVKRKLEPLLFPHFFVFTEFVWPFCRHLKPLRSDYLCILITVDRRLIVFSIEVDGAQHYSRKNFYPGSEFATIESDVNDKLLHSFKFNPNTKLPYDEWEINCIRDHLKEHLLMQLNVHLLRLTSETNKSTERVREFTSKISYFIDQLFGCEVYVRMGSLVDKNVSHIFLNKTEHPGLVYFRKAVLHFRAYETIFNSSSSDKERKFNIKIYEAVRNFNDRKMRQDKNKEMRSSRQKTIESKQPQPNID